MDDSTVAQKKGGGSRSILIIAIIVLLVIAAAAFFLTGGAGGPTVDSKQFARAQREFVLDPDDLPIPYSTTFESPWTNDEVINMLGQVDGKQYLADTARVDGWEVGLARNSSNDIGPETYRSYVQVYETKDGAKTAFDGEWFWSATEDDESFELIGEESCNLGDECIVRSYDRYFQESGLTKLRYEVGFRYGNIFFWVSGKGLDVDINQDAVLDAARAVFERLENYE